MFRQRLQPARPHAQGRCRCCFNCDIAVSEVKLLLEEDGHNCKICGLTPYFPTKAVRERTKFNGERSIQAFNRIVKTPDRTSAAAYPRHLKGQVVADSMALRWPGLLVRQYKFPRVVDRFLVPATPEPLISCQLGGSAVFKERDIGGNWLTHQLNRGTLFVTRSRTPYEVSFASPLGEELENVQIHVAIDVFLAALEAVYPGKSDSVEVIDFFGRDEALAYLCFACAEMLTKRVPAKSERVAHLTKLIASCLAEKYTTAAAEKADFRGGLPVRQLRKVEDYVHEHLADDISLESLAELVELSPFHFSRVFKQTTGMSPLQFVTRERITRAQQLIRETERSLIEIGLEVGYKNPSHFAQVFRRVAGVTPTAFRSAL
jgi:AraC family transcriptional regulator